jgi:class 3 adenylate cyclase
VSFGAVEGEGDALAGAAVDAAAQMEMLSTPGGVCVTQGVWERIEGRVDQRFAELPAAELGGARLRAWRTPTPVGRGAGP